MAPNARRRPAMSLNQLTPPAHRRNGLTHNQMATFNRSCPQLLSFDNELFNKKSVGWAAELVEKEISEEIDRGDMADRWYRKSDLAEFRQECRDTAQLVRQGRLTRKSKLPLCERGLELLFDDEQKQKRRARRRISNSYVLKGLFVLEEQNGQGQERTFSHKFQEELYQDMLALAQEEASSQGLKDEQEARHIRNEGAGDKRSSLKKLPSFRRSLLGKVASAKNVFSSSAA